MADLPVRHHGAAPDFQVLARGGARHGDAGFMPMAVRLADGSEASLSPIAARLWQALVDSLDGSGGGIERVPEEVRGRVLGLSRRSPHWLAGAPSVLGLWLLLGGENGRDMDWAMVFSPEAWMYNRLEGLGGVASLDEGQHALAEAYLRVAPTLAGEVRKAFDERFRRGTFNHIAGDSPGHSGQLGLGWRVSCLLRFPAAAGEEDSSITANSFPLLCRHLAAGADIGDGRSFARQAAGWLAAGGSVASTSDILAVLEKAVAVAAPDGLLAMGAGSVRECLGQPPGGPIDWKKAPAWLRRLGGSAVHAIYEAQAWHDAGRAPEGGFTARSPVLGRDTVRLNDWKPEAAQAAAEFEVGARTLHSGWQVGGRPGGDFKYSTDAMMSVAWVLRTADLALQQGHTPSIGAREALARFVDEQMAFAGGRTLLAGGWLRWLQADPAAHPARLFCSMGIGLDMQALMAAAQQPGTKCGDKLRTLARAADAAWRIEREAPAARGGRRHRA